MSIFFRLLDLPVELVMMIIENFEHKERLEVLSTCRLIRKMDEKYIYSSLKTPNVRLYIETGIDGYEMCSLTRDTFENSIAVLNGIAADENHRKLVKSLKLTAYCNSLLSRSDIYWLSKELTRTFARHFDEQLESLTYINTFYCEFVEKTPFNFPNLKKLTLGELGDNFAFDNWLMNAPNLEKLDIFCMEWSYGMLSHQDICSSSIEKLVKRESNFRLRIFTFEMWHAPEDANDNDNDREESYDEIDHWHSDLIRAIAGVSDFDDLMPYVERYNVREYQMIQGSLKLNNCYHALGHR
ncbi:hypothetical protein J056_003052 [Wallemia ichthyophaga EXF-994]|uniref:F-box domain-containing protein n=1 Tax=Wallemia ichthyophaga (strain EXF-994 / CBS 113033) TaxID=1299270 RepID=R9ANG0_WALI9|nr:uncharacterized protein J056_003052 [Wallemia ichthyophaga EXF-994]EOR03595.1 hypothetical protein J056_003052 [Wallemia ichthyophaga EXF-994]TIB30540.1 hypothetical protein E3P84_03310 [Wallemia ichthyophaga]TIB39871.1 hypothetical protein E3P83_03231 [Wallemia ichthyophaga]